MGHPTRHNHSSGSAVAQCRASDSGVRGRGFETYLRRVVSFSKTLYSPKVLVIPRKRCLRPDMTEKLLTETLNLNTNKQKPPQFVDCLERFRLMLIRYELGHTGVSQVITLHCFVNYCNIFVLNVMQPLKQ